MSEAPSTYSIAIQWRPVGLAAVVDADDVRVLEAGGGLRLAAEALDELRVLGEALVQELERDLAVEHLVVGEPDVGHPARCRAALISV